MGVIDGLTVEEAVQLCCRRHNELHSEELKFLQRITGKADLNKGGGLVRLTGIVRRLRQTDLVAEAQRLEQGA